MQKTLIAIMAGLCLSTPALAQDASYPLPEYDIAGACAAYGDAGSAGCVEQETMAKEHLATLLTTAPAHMGAYCDEMVRESADLTTGQPLYMIAATCVGSEVEGFNLTLSNVSV